MIRGRIAILLGTLMFGFQAQADLKVEKVNSSHTRAHLVGDTAAPKANSTLVHTDEFDVTCRASIVKLESKRIIADISGCKNAKEIKAGDVFTVGGAGSVGSASAGAKPNPEGHPTPNESWYTLWAFGFGSTTYSDDDLNDAFDEAEDAPGVDRSRLALDILGFYWPHEGHKSMSGFVVSGFADTISGPGGDVTINQYTYSYSYHQFFGSNIGDQWFWRGDVGLSRAVVIIDTTSFDADDSTDLKLGGLLGGGYGWGIGQETRMLVGAYYAHRQLEDESASDFSVRLGFLF